jgi:ACR3 family arsenite efflux pump ArsB
VFVISEQFPTGGKNDAGNIGGDRLMKFPKQDIVSLNMTTLARNSPLSLAIAVVTFPEQPLVSLALVIGPLIELPVLSVISGILKRWNQD